MRHARGERFETDGLVRLASLIPQAQVAAMRDCLWQTLLEPAGLARDDPSSWRPGGRLGLEEVLGALRPGHGSREALVAAGQSEAFAPLEPALDRALIEIFGEGSWAPVPGSRGGLAAPNFPVAGPRWTVPHRAWHADEPTDARHAAAWGLLAFVFLDRVEPRGGATVALAGSALRLHQLAVAAFADVMVTEQSIAALAAREPWAAELFAGRGDAAGRARRFMETGCVSGGVPMRVVELTGEPGDVVLMDPRALHTVSANAGASPRLVMRVTCARS